MIQHCWVCLFYVGYLSTWWKSPESSKSCHRTTAVLRSAKAPPPMIILLNLYEECVKMNTRGIKTFNFLFGCSLIISWINKMDYTASVWLGFNHYIFELFFICACGHFLIAFYKLWCLYIYIANVGRFVYIANRLHCHPLAHNAL